jgi:hypothetical protein
VLAVIEDFETLENAGAGLLDGLEIMAVDTFGFERTKAAFHQRVVKGFSLL